MKIEQINLDELPGGHGQAGTMPGEQAAAAIPPRRSGDPGAQAEAGDVPEELDLTFEAGIEKLEQIVKALEQRDVPLEKALSLFRQGVGLVRHCSAQLDSAEREMGRLLAGSGGELRLVPAELAIEG